MECYDCGDTATFTTTEGSMDEWQVVCAVCANYEIAFGYQVFPLTAFADGEA